MGTFMGHVLPGTFFIAFGVYWLVRVFDRLISSRRGGRPMAAAKFRSSATFACATCCGRKRRFQQEAIFKLVAATIGMTGEIVTAFQDGVFKHMGNAQHATMFFAFGLTGVADLLVFYRAPFAPPGLDYAAACVALLVEGVLFMYHLHGFNELETRLHVLLIYVIFANAAAVMFEMKDRHSPIAALARCYCFLMQGTWFWQVAFILYNPLPNHHWGGSGHDSLMFATLYFSWHLLANLAVTTLVGLLVYCCHRKRRGNDAAYSALLERSDQLKIDERGNGGGGGGNKDYEGTESDDQTQA